MDEKPLPPAQGRSAKLLIGLGGLWLLLAIVLLVFLLATPTVEVRWETATEVQTAGFNLYRSESIEGAFEQINLERGLIPSEGDAVSGASYTFIDDTVEVGKTYYYMLEEVEYNSNTERYDEDIFSYQVPYLSPGMAGFTAVCVLIGLVLLVTGLKEDRDL